MLAQKGGQTVPNYQQKDRHLSRSAEAHFQAKDGNSTALTAPPPAHTWETSKPVLPAYTEELLQQGTSRMKGETNTYPMHESLKVGKGWQEEEEEVVVKKDRKREMGDE